MTAKVINGELAKAAGDLYITGMTTLDVSRALTLSISTARAAILASGVGFRSVKDAMKRSGWKISAKHKGVRKCPMSEETKEKIRQAVRRRESTFSGVSKKPNGYIEITVGASKGKSVHRMVAEEMLGRRLLESEQVHHIDGDKSNNTPSNLIVLSREDHARIHAKMNIAKRKRDQHGRLC